jgi:hypothetical protein
MDVMSRTPDIQRTLLLVRILAGMYGNRDVTRHYRHLRIPPGLGNFNEDDYLAYAGLQNTDAALHLIEGRAKQYELTL